MDQKTKISVSDHFLLLPPDRDHNCVWYTSEGNSDLLNPEQIDEELRAVPGSPLFGHIKYDLEEEYTGTIGEAGERKPAVRFSRGAKRNFLLNADSESPKSAVVFNSRTSKKKYLSNTAALLAHIHRGDIYEVNYCIEFFAEQVKIDPVTVFQRLTSLTKAPHACLYRDGVSWLICASPERFLRKTGSKIISQPIKGTRPRGKDKMEDEKLISELKHDQKEISENVMIVDLVRNDLSRIAKRGTVKVDELCGIYTFESVHQMISTVSADVRENTTLHEILRSAFPMGSMTGAPKIRAMQLIDEFEDMKRGIYSGSVGIIQPNGDFDLNVVIRSIEYNEQTGYLSIKVGSAITANCDPEKEYAECLVKAQPMLSALNATIE